MKNSTNTYEILSITEPTSTEDLMVNLKVIDSGKSFHKSLKELYDKAWLPHFSREDVAYIGFLTAATHSAGLIPTDSFPRRQPRLTHSVIAIAIAFICLLMLSNMTAFRVSELSIDHLPFFGAVKLQFPAALVLFPATYAFSNILTEVYGYHTSRLVIWGGLAANALFVAGTWAISLLPTSPQWAIQSGFSAAAYETIFFAYSKTFLASSLAYFISEFVNSYVLSKLKIISRGKYQPLRILTSTGFAVTLDSAIFCSLMFHDVMTRSEIHAMIAVQIAMKFSYELLLFPITMKLSEFLKKRDDIDYYDYNTKFNPFAIRG